MIIFAREGYQADSYCSYGGRVLLCELIAIFLISARSEATWQSPAYVTQKKGIETPLYPRRDASCVVPA